MMTEESSEAAFDVLDGYLSQGSIVKKSAGYICIFNDEGECTHFANSVEDLMYILLGEWRSGYDLSK